MSDTATGDDDTAGSDVSESVRMSQELQTLRAENTRLMQQLQQQQQQRESMSRCSPGGDSVQLDFIHAQQELSRCKEALIAMKADRKRLASEKIDLVSQMKELYNTLKNKESELRDFIRNYEQRTKDNNDLIKQLSEDKENLEIERHNAVCRCEMLTDELSSLQTELRLKNDLVARLKRLLTQAKPPVDVASLSSTQHLVCLDTSHNCSFNDSMLLSTSVVNTCSVDHVPSYQEMFNVDHVTVNGCAPAAEPIPRTSSMSEGKPPAHRRRLIAQRASQLAASHSHQQQQQPGGAPAQYRHNSFTGTTSSGVYSTLSSSDSRVMPRRRASLLVHRETENKLATIQEAHRLPVSEWKASHVLAWLEVDMNMAAYGQACFDNIKSGKILLGLSDAELESALRLESSLHRRKMRLAIEELRDPATVQYPNASKLDQCWVASDWLYSLGLSQYSGVFETQLVDARLLNVLSKKDLDKHLNIHNKFHQSSILHGVQLLRMLRFDIQALEERRNRCQNVNSDVIVWTNQRLKQWADQVDLQEYAEKLKDSGVHGAVLVLDVNVTADVLANLLAIPTAKSYVRRHLATEYDVIVQPARSCMEHNKKASSTSKSTVARSHSGGTSHAHSSTSADDMPLPGRNSARRLSFKGSVVRALRGRSASKELPTSSSSSAATAAAE